MLVALKPPLPVTLLVQHPQPSTLKHQPSTINPQPSTLNPQPSTLNQHSSTRNPKPEARNPKSQTRNLKPAAEHTGAGTVGAQPSTLNHQPETRNPQPEPRNPKQSTRNPKSEARNQPRNILERVQWKLFKWTKRRAEERLILERIVQVPLYTFNSSSASLKLGLQPKSFSAEILVQADD